MLSFPMYDHTLVPIYYGPSYLGFGGILMLRTTIPIETLGPLLF